MSRILALAAALLAACASASSASNSPTVQTAPDCVVYGPFPLAPAHSAQPFTYRDSVAGILLYVESDGRHLAAFSPEGDLLWVRNPFEEKHLCPYRTERPIIVRIVPFPESLHARVAGYLKRQGPFIQIEFDSSQFGAVDLPTGDFQPMGNN